jgi:cell division ATPase FtsA
MRPKTENYLVGIDIGSSKVGVLIGHRDGHGGLEVVGKGLAPTAAPAAATSSTSSRRSRP